MRFLLKFLVIVSISACTFATDLPVMTRGFSGHENINYAKYDGYYSARCPSSLSSTDCVAIASDICRREGFKFIKTGPVMSVCGSGRNKDKIAFSFCSLSVAVYC